MVYTKKVYKSPQSGQPLITTISSGCITPVLEVKFCNLLNPFYYPNAPKVPRYSVTCIIDPESHAEFLDGIRTIEKNESVESILKFETQKTDQGPVNTGKVLMKFQGKDKIPVYFANEVFEQEQDRSEVELHDELAKGELIQITYDILRYTKKNTMETEHGISFKPTSIWYYPKEEHGNS